MEINKKIIDDILSKIPGHLSLVDFLTDALCISKESVYRRIRGDVAFTLEDIIKLSSRLNISLDDIMYANQNNEIKKQPIIFQSGLDKTFEPQKTFLNFLTAYAQNIDELSKHQDVDIMVATNRLMILTTVSYSHLFKFYYYKWMHQTQNNPLDFSLSDIILSDEIITLQEKLKKHARFGNHTYILDTCFLKNTIREIRYYYKRQLISNDDMILIQNDLYKFLDVMVFILSPKTEKGNYSSCIYLSENQVESSGLYCKYGDEQMISLWISYGISIMSQNPRICGPYYSWLNSLKKYSSLISGCNQVLQMKFINRQRDYIDNIMNKDLFYE